ncbi:hypothetical protein [Acidithrix ferrooxidans]|uniref:hypothetical protein n=2 Tax=Acidithrix TaxID=1609233 RepID=UPI00126A3F42|nr:hypothetical protein [Acidithrix ferrooxidans]
MKVCGMAYMDGELNSVATTSPSRHFHFPKEFREYPDDMGRPSQFWARKTTRRQESAPHGLPSTTITRLVAT